MRTIDSRQSTLTLAALLVAPGFAAWTPSAAAAAVEARVAAIEAAGSIEPKNVCDALAQVDFDSRYGRIRFQENGQILLPQTVIQIQDGQVVEIFADRLISRPLYPAPPWDNRS